MAARRRAELRRAGPAVAVAAILVLCVQQASGEEMKSTVIAFEVISNFAGHPFHA